MRKAVAILLFASFFACSASGYAKDVKKPAAAASSKQAIGTQGSEPAVVDLNRENPIDRAFAKGFAEAQATPEIQLVSEAYLEAWKAEMANAAAAVKKSFTHRDDDKRVEDYLAAYDTLIGKAFDLEMLNWVSDSEESIASRSFGTGATGAAMLTQGRLYKQATLNLITHLQANPDVTYTFLYNGKGVDLKQGSAR